MPGPHADQCRIHTYIVALRVCSDIKKKDQTERETGDLRQKI